MPERPYVRRMSSFHIPDGARRSVEQATRVAARLRLAVVTDPGVEPLTREQGRRLLRAIDAVCHHASPDELPFDDYAVLDELSADLADWLGAAPVAA